MVRCVRLERDHDLRDPISPSDRFIPDQTNAPLALMAASFGLKLVLDPVPETDLGTWTNSSKARSREQLPDQGADMRSPIDSSGTSLDGPPRTERVRVP